MGAPEYSPDVNRRKTEVGAFLASLMTSARSASLYKPGHPMIAQVAERLRLLLVKTLGQQPSLVLDVKAKSVLVDEAELPETPETTGFAVALHTLGVGQVALTERVTSQGLVEFFGILTAKPDDAASLTDLQKAVQNVRIDGLQMVFILDFVVTGEQEEKNRPPGALTAEQVEAFCRARTLPDLLWLLLKQNEELTGKEAEAVTQLLDGAAYRDLPLERVAAELPWSLYDPRIRARFDELRGQLAWAPKREWREGRALAVRPRARWNAAGLRSWCTLVEEAELSALKSQPVAEKRAALLDALARLRALLDAPEWERHRKFVVFAYLRALAELARDGDVQTVLAELPRWKAVSAKGSPALSQLLRDGVRAKVMGPATAERFAGALLKAPKDGAEAAGLAELALYFGNGFVPLLLEQLRGLQDKEDRQRLCELLVALGRSLGDKELAAALADEDWLLVTHVVAVLSELDARGRVADVAALMRRGHKRIRDSATKFLVKYGGSEAVTAIGDFLAVAEDEDEVTRTVIAFSRLADPGVDAKLIEAYRKSPLYETRVAVCRALSRFPSAASIALLKEAATRTWYEIVSGLNRELHGAARESLELLRKEGRA